METLLQSATRLFAALGYDATTMRQIADATGIDPVRAGFTGNKRDLYLAVIERAHQIEVEAMGSVIESAELAGEGEVTAAVHRIVDTYLNFCVAHPEFPALWIHRWLYDAADLIGLEREFSQPLITTTTRVLRHAVADQSVDIEYCVWTLVWCVHGFVQGGVLDGEGERIGAESGEELARFRRHLHMLIHRVLGLPGDVPD
ncbi:TetR/AcrR family transcriptional regulator [Acrocarpospora catenulata]|uniref:TetR/AcrR family transcriptional regulator n=1 Tax=Acrocarpospora catenulata TaxID=2836182 RepID=UPI002023A4E1|nr:TetR/AcrR family transcriptional regulator [Acrocarpospora catenulata]